MNYYFTVRRGLKDRTLFLKGRPEVNSAYEISVMGYGECSEGEVRNDRLGCR